MLLTNIGLSEMGKTRINIDWVSSVSFKKWLRIILPEVQLIDFINKEGFQGKQKQSVAGAQIPVGGGKYT